MNVEQSFVKSDKVEEIINIVKTRINTTPDIGKCQPNVGLPNSYDLILAKDQKRKVAISDCKEGWVSILESKEVNDYKMLLDLSKILETEILTIVISDVTGTWGFAEFHNGEIINKYFSEEDDNIETFIKEKLNEKGIKIPLYMFKEIASRKTQGWNIITKSK